ncbi:hypothetical protein [Vibrio palustris]|uniref:Uncharacterized protein n=1 Tax=Vibrio palustris TaxID=1918946 RepID=A0A1R4B6Y5_9VIBR|nr:hypothetical protein [Vibrio palustris]SJL84683.1 hypothetical protein VPAL9027_02679 [Vibrio palustris]
MSSNQFEQIKDQVEQLTPQQLKALQGMINYRLDDRQQDLLTDEERHLITSLFA